MAVHFLCSKFGRNIEFWHNWLGINIIKFHLFGNFLCIGYNFRHIGKYSNHLFGRFQPLLFCVAQTVRVVIVFSHAQANKSVVRLAVFLLYKMNIVGSHYFCSRFFRQIQQYGIYFLLALKHLLVSTRLSGLMALYLDIIIVSDKIFKPSDSLFSTVNIAVHYFLRKFTAKTSRTNNQSFVVLFQQRIVDARIVVKAVGVSD